MEENKIYNHPDNSVYVKTNGDEIHIICKREDQMDEVVQRPSTDNCHLSGYEEWDEGEDKKWILKFLVSDEESDYIVTPEYN